MKGSIIISTNDKTGCRGNPKQMANYAQELGKNSSKRLIETFGTFSKDINGALTEMEALALGTNADKFLYHYQICPSEGLHLTDEQMHRSVEVSKKQFGLEGTQHIVWEDVEKNGDRHWHVCCNRVKSRENGTLYAQNMPHEARKKQAIAVALEKEFGLEGIDKKRCLLNQKDGERAPKNYTYQKAEMSENPVRGYEYQRAERNDLINPKLRKACISQMYAEARNGKEFAKMIKEYGYVLGQGEKCDFIIVSANEKEEAHNLRRELPRGTKGKELTEKFSDLDRDSLPKEAEARILADQLIVTKFLTEEIALGASRDAGRNDDKAATVEQEPKKELTVSQIILKERAKADNVENLIEVLQGHGLTIAKVTLGESNKSQLDHAMAEKGKFVPVFKTGDIVALNEKGYAYRVTQDQKAVKEPWMSGDSFDSLSPELKEQAKRSYTAWVESKKEQKQDGEKPRKTFALGEYVDYVQARWRKAEKLDFKKYDSSALPTLTEARQSIRDEKKKNQPEQELLPDTNKMIMEMRDAFWTGTSGQQIFNTLSSKEFIVACVDRVDEARYKELHDKALDDGLNRVPPLLKKGEIVAINKYGNVVKLNHYNTGLSPDRLAEKLKDVDVGLLPTVSKAIDISRLAENLKGLNRYAERKAKREEREAEWEQKINSPAQKAKRVIASAKKIGNKGVRKAESVAYAADGITTKTIASFSKLQDLATSVLEAFIAPPEPKKISPLEYLRDVKARQLYNAQKAQAEAREEAREFAYEKMRQTKTVTRADLHALNREEVEQIKMRGDDGLQMLLRQFEQDKKKQREAARGRER